MNLISWLNFGPPDLVPFDVRTPLKNTTESFALYGQFDWNATDKLGFLAGGRWTDEEKDFSLDGALSFVPVDNSDLIAAGIPLEQNVDKFTYKLGVDYQFTDDIMSYFTYTTGFKSGGWNARGFAPEELTAFGPEEVASFELGLRSEWLDNRLRTNLTIFQARYDDIQIATVEPAFDPDAPNLFITTNAGDSKITGAELEVASAVTDNLQLYGNLGYMDGEYTSLTQGGMDANIGPEPARTPEWNLMVGGDFTIPDVLFNGDIFLGGQVAWEDDYFMGNDNAIETLIVAHTLVNAQVGWRNDNWEAIVECKNCLDEEWFGTNLFDVLYPADPVRWGIRVKYSYQ